MNYKHYLFLICCMVFCNQAKAASCYEEAGLLSNAKLASKEIFVLIDQTTDLPGSVKTQLFQQINDIAKPGNEIYVFSFSEFGRDSGLREIGKFAFEQGMQARDDISLRKLKTLDHCLQLKMVQQKRALRDVLSYATADIKTDAKHSEILATLKMLSVRVSQSKSMNKVVLVVSDMLEHSAITSFYQNAEIRKINVDEELKHIPAELKANFSGAKIFILGGGLASKDKQVRDTTSLVALSQFWNVYCKASNATLVEFGMPNLLSRIQ